MKNDLKKKNLFQCELIPQTDISVERTVNQTLNSKTIERFERDLLMPNNFFLNALKNEINFKNFDDALFFNFGEEKSGFYNLQKFSIIQTNFEFIATKKSKQILSKKVFVIQSRSYIFPTNSENFTSFQIYICNVSRIEYLTNFIKSSIKTIIIFSIYFYIWIYLMLFIESIYKQYGQNIIQICVMPLISMLVIKLAITFNLMMLLTTLILYYFGDYFLNKKKLSLIKMIIFKALVSPLAFHHYSALRVFIKFMKNQD